MNLTAGSAVEEFHRRGYRSLMFSIWDLFLTGQTPEQVKAFLQNELQHHPAAMRGQMALVDDCYATWVRLFLSNNMLCRSRLFGK